MAETVQDLGTGKKWHWYSVMADLREQGGLDDVIIDPLSTQEHGCGGDYHGNRFYITWVHGVFLLLTMQQFNQALVDAFATVVEYRPFCRYDSNGMVTIEWDKDNPDSRFTALESKPKITNLTRLA